MEATSLAKLAIAVSCVSRPGPRSTMARRAREVDATRVQPLISPALALPRDPRDARLESPRGIRLESCEDATGAARPVKPLTRRKAGDGRAPPTARLSPARDRRRRRAGVLNSPSGRVVRSAPRCRRHSRPRATDGELQAVR